MRFYAVPLLLFLGHAGARRITISTVLEASAPPEPSEPTSPEPAGPVAAPDLESPSAAPTLGSELVVPGEGNATVGDVLKSVKVLLLVFKKIGQTVVVALKWNNAKLALEQAKVTAKECLDVLKDITMEVPRVAKLVGKGALYTFFKKLNAEKLSVGDFVMDIKIPESAEDSVPKMIDAIDEVQELVMQIGKVVNSNEVVVNVLTTVQEFADAVKDLSETLVNFNFSSVVQPIVQGVKKANTAIQEVMQKVHTTLKGVRPLLGGLASAALSASEEVIELAAKKAKEQCDLLKAKFPNFFSGLEALLPLLFEIFKTVVEPLIPEVMKALEIVVHHAEDLFIRDPGPDYVAEENISAGGNCVWRSTRYFEELDDVDSQNTMLCTTSKRWYGRYECHCRGTKDCYADYDNRPEPKKIRRCFKPAA